MNPPSLESRAPRTLPASVPPVRHAISLAVAGTLLALAVLAGGARAADLPAGSVAAPVPALRLVRPVCVDGLLRESAWQQPPSISRLTQERPFEGAAPSESTWVWIAYDDDAPYLAARMWDAHPDSIAAPLARRDTDVAADFAGLLLDPFDDLTRRPGSCWTPRCTTTAPRILPGTASGRAARSGTPGAGPARCGSRSPSSDTPRAGARRGASISRAGSCAAPRRTSSSSPRRHVQPLVSAARFSGFKELARGGSYEFVRYGRDGGSSWVDGVVDPGNGGTPFPLADPSFNVKSLRGNAVLRWEYRTGSVVYFIWTQRRSDEEAQGELRLGRSTRRLFDAGADNVFLVKATYHLSL